MVIVTAENKIGLLKQYRTTLVKKNQSWKSEMSSKSWGQVQTHLADTVRAEGGKSER